MIFVGSGHPVCREARSAAEQWCSGRPADFRKRPPVFFEELGGEPL